MTASPVRRVLMTADAVGGVWTYALDLARSMGASGIAVWLAVMGPAPRPAQAAAAARMANLTVLHRPFALEWMPDPWRDVAAASDWLLGLEREFEPDVVQINGYAHAAAPFLAPKVVVAHSCVLSWWRAVKGEDAPAAEWGRYARAVEAGLGAADLVIAPTAAMLRALREHYHFSSPATVVPNGRDERAFHSAPKEPFIFCAGRLWDEAKNLSALVRIAGELPWPVRVAGAPEAPGGGRGPEAAGVAMLGHLSEEAVAREMASASLYCLPARYEPFGLSALEAAMSGCALVLGDIASLREVWGDAAVFVDPGNPDDLRRTLLDLIQDEERRGDLGRRARGRAADYGAAAAARRTLDAYCAVAHRRMTEFARCA